MNWDRYNQIVEFFSFATEPLMSLYQAQSSPFVGTLLFGLFALFTPSRLTANLLMMLYVTDGIAKKQKWLHRVGYLYAGQTLGSLLLTVLFLLFDIGAMNTFFTITRKLSGIIILMFAIYFLIILRRSRKEKGKKYVGTLQSIQGMVFSFFLVLVFDPLLFVHYSQLVSSFLSFSLIGFMLVLLVSFASFLPVFLYSIFTYGFEWDRFVRKTDTRVLSTQLTISILFIIIAVNELIMYW